MLQSKLFYKTSKEDPKGAVSLSHKLLLRAGYVDQLMAGVFTFLPLGFRVLKKIEAIIRKNMVSPPLSAQELLLPALNPKENWEKTGRWEELDILFKIRGKGEKDYTLAPTHEEIISPLAAKIIFSYKDLPLYLFQIQDKFRDELRTKSGLLRTREFIMKDLYSFHRDEKDLDSYFKKVAGVYLKIFKECGIRKEGKEKITYQTLASGGTFSDYSYEFQTITPFGEDIIYICSKCSKAVNQEFKKDEDICPFCGKKTQFRSEKAVEVGNIFKLGDKYSLPFDLKFRDRDAKEKPVMMGCYGLGLGRIMAAAVEVNNDEKGIIWPLSIAPFKIHLIVLEPKPKLIKTAEKIYQSLQKENIQVLYDDRKEKSSGEKLAESDLLGIPYRIVISERTIKQKKMEVRRRDNGKIKMISVNNINLLLKDEIV